jgi:hypothetical protein
MPRICYACERPIYECMGSVAARDIVDERRPPRERCSLCVARESVHPSFKPQYLYGPWRGHNDPTPWSW